jgi:hypothetical protein
LGGEKFWAWVGKASALLGLILIFVNIIIAVAPEKSTPQCILAAEVIYQDHSQPDPVKAEWDKVATYFNTLPDPALFPPESEDLKLLVDDLFRLKSELPYLLTKPGFRSAYHARIRNTGALPCEEVQLELDNASIVELPRAGETATEDTNGIIQVGTLRPGADIHVIAWTSAEADSYTPFPRLNAVALSHSLGPGKIELKNPHPLSREFLESIEKQTDNVRTTLYITLILVGSAMAVLVIAWGAGFRSKPESANVSSSPEPGGNP